MRTNKFDKSLESSGVYQSRWKNEEEIPNLGPFSDIYESAKNHVQFTQLIVRGDDGTLLNSRHERKKMPVYMRGTQYSIDPVQKLSSSQVYATFKYIDQTP